MIMTSFIWAQIIGIFILIANYISDFKKKDKDILITNAIVNVLCSVQYFLLGGYTGTLCCIIAVIRNILFYGRKKEKTFWFLVIYLFLNILIGVICYDGIFSLLPVVCACIYSIALWSKDEKLLKKCLIIIGTMGTIYDISVKAYSGLSLNLIDLITGLIQTIKYSKEKKKRKKNKLVKK